MKKKTLLILLIIPFIISLLTFVSVSILTNQVETDITDIIWTYNENQGFKISDDGYRLIASSVYDENLLLAPGNNLVWEVKDLDGTSTDLARIEQEDDEYYLYAIKEGECQVICRNERGSLSKYFRAHIYENGAIIVNTSRKGSGSNIDPNRYYGEYDLVYSALEMDKANATEAKFSLTAKEIENNNPVFAVSETDNVVIDSDFNVTVKGSGEAIIRFFTTSEPYLTTYYKVEIIKDGYNVYNYNDLLMCTNFSSEGKKIVLQSHLESLENLYKKDVNNNFTSNKLEEKENYELFGNFDFVNQTFNFNNEIVSLPSNYNINFINQYNSSDKGEYLNPNIKVGLLIQDDIYGNGYSINANGLTFPNHGKINSNGKLTPNPDKDYFFGPLPFVTIGSLTKTPVVKVYGQDNALLYIKGSDIKINDIKVKNCNEVDNMYNLLYTGSVIDVEGKNVDIRNSVLSNGRTIVRAFSSDGLIISNSILKNAAQFIMSLGNNEYNSYQDDKNVQVNYEGEDYSNTLGELFNYSNTKGADQILTSILNKTNLSDENELNKVMDTLHQIQDGLDNTNNIIDDENNVIYQSEVNLNKVYFANSGIFSIAFEALFNGPYLYNGMPSSIYPFLEVFSSLLPNKIAGTMYPVKLNISDDTKFYDYKNIDSIDTSVLIEENISEMISGITGRDTKLSMEDYFPMKSLLKEEVGKTGNYYEYQEKQYINSKIAWYGGGLNLSSANINITDKAEILDVDLAKSVLSGKYIDSNEYITLLARCVLVASGTHPFRFLTNGEINGVPEEFNKVPQIEDLR